MLRVLLFTRALEYVHESTQAIVDILRGHALAPRCSFVCSSDATLFEQPSLSRDFDVIVFVQTSGDVLAGNQLEAFRMILEEGTKGFCALHAAADTLRGSAWYRDVIGCIFVGHPPIQKGQVTFSLENARVLNGASPPFKAEFADEWYNFDRNVFSLPDTWVVATVDESSYNHGPYEKSEWNGTRMGNPHPIVWFRHVGKSRIFYSGIGHAAETYEQPFVQDLVLNAILWCGFASNETSKLSDQTLSRPFVQHAIRNTNDVMEVVVEYNGLAQERVFRQLIPVEFARSVHFVVSDSNVDPLYGQLVEDGLCKAGFANVVRLVVPHGESSKNLTVFTTLASRILASKVDKHSALLSLGGGMVNNLAGMLASTIYRGLRLVHLPTSLLAQVDAAVDFKQAVNFECGKNQLGSMYAPSMVFIDTKCLSSLPLRERINGMGEAIKHALAQDPEFYDFLSRHSVHSLSDVNFMHRVVKVATSLKVALLNTGQDADVFDMIAQYGHAVGHAIEHLSKYELGHGEAIAIGMCISSEIGLILGHCLEETVCQHYHIFQLYGLPTLLPDSLTFESIKQVLSRDKHYYDGIPRMMILKALGVPVVENEVTCLPIAYDTIEDAIKVNRSRSAVYRNKEAV